MRSQDQVKNNILQSVGTILKEEGYTGLYIRNIAKRANTSGKMIYYHFGNLDNLVEAYIRQKDHLQSYKNELDSTFIIDREKDPKAMIKDVLIGHFLEFDKNEEMQKIITWEISEYTDILRKEADMREEFGELIFKEIEPYFENEDLDFRSLCAIIISGIYYLVLHAKTNGSVFCGRDYRRRSDKELLLKTIDKLIDTAFDLAKK